MSDTLLYCCGPVGEFPSPNQTETWGSTQVLRTFFGKKWIVFETSHRVPCWGSHIDLGGDPESQKEAWSEESMGADQKKPRFVWCWMGRILPCIQRCKIKQKMGVMDTGQIKVWVNVLCGFGAFLQVRLCRWPLPIHSGPAGSSFWSVLENYQILWPRFLEKCQAVHFWLHPPNTTPPLHVVSQRRKTQIQTCGAF